jgi:8-oxo-dGTP diphosphatase
MAALDQLVAVAVVASSSGVLAGRRREGAPPWVFPGGKVEPGESIAHAAVREVAEETGLQVQAGSEIGRRVHPVTNRWIVYLACTATSDPSDAATVVCRELSEVRWLGLAELDQLMPDVFLPVREHLGRLLI